MMEYQTTVNGIGVRATYREETVHEIFLPLLKRLSGLQSTKGRRILVMLAAPPGAGKSTLLSFLEHLTHSCRELPPIQTVGMDGFHRRQEYLQTHFVKRDGKDIAMVGIKGAPVTFDLEKLTESVRKMAEGESCMWPVYNRLLHNPEENALTIDGKIVMLEGNYLLLDEDGWRDLKGYADYTVSVCAEEDFLRRRLIDRRIKTGVEAEEAARFVDFSDMPNVRVCLEKTMPADLRLSLGADGDYHVILPA